MGNIAGLYETLGVAMPSETGANVQEVADPAETGVNVQEVADPAEQGANEQGVTDPDASPRDDDPEGAPAQPSQTKEQRAEQARLRRETERKAAVDAAVREERERHAAELKSFFAKAGLTDPSTGKPIETMEQFNTWHQSAQLAAVQKDLKAGKLTPQSMEQLIENSPTMLRAKQQLDAAETAAKQARAEQHKQLLQNELAEIRKLNPKINSLNDILAMETGQEWARYVNEHNLSYVQAYRLANQDSLLAQARQVADAGAQIRSSGKSHLKPDAVRGQTAVEVPKKIMDMYRLFQPGWTEAQIQQDYQKRSAK